MNQQEWLEYFELVNGRKPSPAEMAEAKAAGEFQDDQSQVSGVVVAPAAQGPVNPVVTSPQMIQGAQGGNLNTQASPFQAAPLKKGLAKKTKIILISVLGSLVGLCLIIGGYSLFRYQSGKIADGTYEVVAYSYYDEDEDKMVDGLKELEDDDIDVKDFLTVENNRSKHYNYSEDDDSVSVSIFENDLDVSQVFDPWNRTQSQTLTTSEYKDEVEKYTKDLQKDYSFYTDDAVKDTVDNSVKEYKKALKQIRTYVKNGNQFTLSFYNEDGELESRITYRLMSQEDGKDRRDDYKDAVKDYKDSMEETSELYDRYFGDDSDYGYNYGYNYGDSYDSSSSDDTDSSRRIGDTI